MDKTSAPTGKGERPNGARPRLRRHTLLAVLALSALLAATGSSCSNGGDEATSVAPDQLSGATAGEAAPADDNGAGASDRAATAGAATGVATEGATVAPETPADPRQVILDGDLELEVDHLDEALAAAEQAVLEAGGQLADQQVDNASGGWPMATATYRVPPAEFRPVVDTIGKLGEVRSQQLGSQDVSAEVADLDSRLETLAVSIDRLRGFLAATTDANQIAMLESELTSREAEAASIAAQRRALGDQVEMATLSVTFHSASETPPVEPSPEGFAGGWEAGRDAATTAVRGTLAAIGFVLPFLPLVLVVVAAVVLLKRRRRNRIAQERPAVP